MQTNSEYRMVFICFVYIMLFVYMENVLKPCDRLKPNSAVNIRPLTYQCVFTRYKLLEHDILSVVLSGKRDTLVREKNSTQSIANEIHIYGINEPLLLVDSAALIVTLYFETRQRRLYYYFPFVFRITNVHKSIYSFIIFGPISNTKHYEYNYSELPINIVINNQDDRVRYRFVNPN